MIDSRGFAILLGVGITLCSGTAFAQMGVAGKTLTINTAAAPIEKIFEEIQRQTGVTLRASSDTRKDVMLLRVKDAPLAEVMKMIALADGAEWTRQSTAYRLTRSESTSKQQAREENAMRAPLYRAALQRNLAVQKRASIAENAHKFGELAKAIDQGIHRLAESNHYRDDLGPLVREAMNRLPISHLMTRLLCEIDPVELASIEPEISHSL